MPNQRKIRDVVRGSIIDERMHDPAFRDKVIGNIKKKFEVTRIKDRYAKPLPYNYKDVLLNVKGENGMEHEIQLHHPNNFNLREKTHPAYARVKIAKKEGDKKKVEKIENNLAKHFDKAHKKPTTVALIDDHANQVYKQVLAIYKGTPIEFKKFPSYKDFRKYGKRFNVIFLDYDLGLHKPTGLDVLPSVKKMSDRVVGFSDNEQHDELMKSAGSDDFVLKVHPKS